MFSGIIRHSATVHSLLGTRLLLACELFDRATADPVLEGDSISVNGVCLTVVAIDAGCAAFDLSEETLRRSTLGTLRDGQLVNVERSLQFGARVDGHLVQGHVDAIATVVDLQPEESSIRIAIEVPAQFQSFLAEKGSICLDGVSLTVGALQGPVCFVYIVPFTLDHTTIAAWEVGTKVNLEVDVLMRYVHAALGGKQYV